MNIQRVVVRTAMAAALTPILLLASCGGSHSSNLVPSAHADSGIPKGFTSGSEVKQVNDKTWFIGAEAIVANAAENGTPVYEIPFQLPPSGTVRTIEGTVSFRTPCNGQFLSFIMLDGMRIANANGKVSYGGGAVTLFVKYDMPIAYTSGNARLHVEADPVCDYADRPNTWEMQGLLQLQ
jgi:hypothetical protein